MSLVQAMTQAADKVSEKAVPLTEKATTKIEEKAAQVSNWKLLPWRACICVLMTLSAHI